MEPKSQSRSQRAIFRFNTAFTILETTKSSLKTIEWLRGHGLLEYLRCDACKVHFSLISNKGNVCDDFVARCPTCKREQSLRTGSFLDRFRISLVELTRIIFYHFLQRHTQTQIARETGLNKNTVSSVCRLVRKIIHIYMQYTYSNFPFGEKLAIERDPDGNIMRTPACEIDETMICHKTLSDGTKKQIWCFGLYDRSSKEYKIFVIPNRSAQVLIPIITKHVYTAPNNPTRIYSDGWAAYLQLTRYHYEHRRINHTIGFGLGSETTNGIESFWSQLKSAAGSYHGIKGSTRKEIQIKLDTALWFLVNKNTDLIQELVDVFALVKNFGVEVEDDDEMEEEEDDETEDEDEADNVEEDEESKQEDTRTENENDSMLVE